jgi:hypothetical protein
MPAIVLSALSQRTSSILIAFHESGIAFLPHLTGEETQAQRDRVTTQVHTASEEPKDF